MRKLKKKCLNKELGHWSEMKCIQDNFGDFHFGYQCSRCGAIMQKTKYCGNCGIEMDNPYLF